MNSANQTGIAAIIEKTNLEEVTKQSLRESFLPFFEKAQEWNEKAKSLSVTSIEQKKEMQEAREARLALKEIRVNVEKRRKELKEDSLRKGKAIDDVANILKSLIEPTEAYLEEQEKFKERYEAEQKKKLSESRMAELKEVDVDGTFYSLGDMPEDQYLTLLNNSRIAKDERARKAAEEQAARLAEEKRIAEERAERERLEVEAREQQRLENERLKKEAEEREKVLAEERAKAEAERKAAEEKLRKEREEQEKILAAERAERERLQKELAAKAEAERKAAEQAKAALEAELSKGDLGKFKDFISDLEILKTKYSFKSTKYQSKYKSAIDLLQKMIDYLNK